MKTFCKIYVLGFLIVIFFPNITRLFHSVFSNYEVGECIEQDNTFKTMDDEIFSALKSKGYSTSILSEYQSINEFFDANMGEKTKYFDGKTIVKLKGYLSGDHMIDRKRGSFTIYNNRRPGLVGFSEGERVEIFYKDNPDFRKYIVNKSFKENYILVKGNINVYTDNLDELYIKANSIIFIPIK